MLVNKCYLCYAREASPWQDDCPYCQLSLRSPDGEIVYNANYQSWVIDYEFHTNKTDNYSPETSYHTCIRCGELVSGRNASVRHWESDHMSKVFPDGLPFSVVAD